MRRRWLRTKERDRAIVYTTDEQVLDGLLVTDASDGIVLIDVRVRSDNDIALQGEIYVPRERVRFVQLLARPS